MTLEVPFAAFVATVRRTVGDSDVYLARHARGTLVTSARPESNVVVASVNPFGFDQTKSALEAAGVVCHAGSWFDPESPAMATSHIDIYVGAVAYRSSESSPGIWVDVYDSIPTQVQVLRAWYEEFRETGEVNDVTFEDFVRQAEPNVAIVTPTELQSFLEAKFRENC